MTDDEIERAMLGVWQDVPGAVNFGIAKPLTDRELLELAAKAAGIAGEYCVWHSGTEPLTTATGIYRDDEGRLWNPLDDDGDALRLAVILGLANYMEFNLQPLGAMVTRIGENKLEMYESTDPQDLYAATRRAIVRAAAEIGRKME